MVAGCLGDDTELTDDHGEEHTGVVAQRDAYVVAYHWGYAAFDEDGQELDVIEISPNTEVTIHAVNDHAYDAFEALPDPVAAQLEDFDGLARLKAKVENGELPTPSGGRTVEEVYEMAHGHDDDHGHDDGHGDGHHEGDGHGHDEDDGHHGDDEHGHDEDDGHHEDDGHGHEGGMLDHGFRLHGIDFEVPADAEEPETGSTVFEEPGTYQAYCTVPCGEYHSHQRQDLVRVGEE